MTLNLDVLTEDFIPKESVTSKPDEKKAEKKTTKAKPAAKKETAKPKKPAVQKTASPKKPKKPAPIKKAVAKTKYQVRESAEQDEHDRLKPRAKPVPEVKVIAFEEKKAEQAAKEKAAETAAAEKAKAEKTAKEEVIVLKEPPLSKLFLEQERQKKEEAEKKAKAEAEEKKAVPARKPKPVPAPKTLLSRDAVRKEREKEEAQKAAAAAEAKKKHSVVRVAGNLTPQERSLELLKKVPDDSATAQAVTKGRRLSRIFAYENTSAELTPEMQESLDRLAAALKKAPGKRVILYTYASPTEPDYGRERQISLRRALMIRSYLSRAGIRSLRVEIRSQGEKGAGTKLPDRADILIYER